MLKNRFKVVNDLGSGASADVKLVQDITSGAEYACKLFKMNKNGMIPKQLLSDTQKEVSILKGLRHRNIINV